MKHPTLIAGALLAFALPAAAQWSDNFDSYPVNTVLDNVGGWFGWDNVPAVAGNVIRARSRSAPHSLFVGPTTDAVHPQLGLTSGRWTLTAWQYISTGGLTADVYLILNNVYSHGGPYTWATQLSCSSTTATVTDDLRTGTPQPIVFDQWVEYRLEIDLGANTVTNYYNGAQVSQGVYAVNGGPVAIENLDLYSAGGTCYWDDIRVVFVPRDVQAPAPTRMPPAAPSACNSGGATGQDQPTINRFSGEFLNTRTDVNIPGRGPGFCWTRTTRSGVQMPAGASGNSATAGYDVRLVASGLDRIVSDGMGNDDVFRLQPDGSWVATGVFRRLVLNPDNSYTLTFEDTGVWELFSLTVPFVPGKLRQVRDRNGNTIDFAYNSQGRITSARDTLGKDVLFTYDAAGHLVALGDCLGRTVRYAYYQAGELGGTTGDLKTVTTPAVTGTPNGNDFPNGKTTTYAYTRGFADPALNSDLLTITDAKGQTYLTNGYAHTVSPNDFRFTTDPTNLYYGRLVRQAFGNPGDLIDWVYEAQTPSAANNFAVILVIENDRKGNVREDLYDAKNNHVIERHYTGRANENLPTTSTSNRPGAPLRATDPAFFETRWQYSADGLVTRVDHPEGNFTQNVYEIDLNPAADPISRGNLREVHRNAGPRGSLSQAVISTFYTYRAGTGGCCGSNFMLTETDGRGGVRTHTYDAAGNRIRTVDRIASIVHDWTYNVFGQVASHTWPSLAGRRRVDTYAYYTSGVQTGYLQQSVVDQGGLGLTTRFECDCVGNVTREIDPRGLDTVSIHNQLDQVVAKYTPEATPGGTRYETLTYYDANDNVVRVDVENRDDTGALGTNTHFTTAYEYEVLNRVTTVTREVTPTSNVIVRYTYDSNRNVRLTRKGESTNGHQTQNIAQTEYDERDLLFQTIRAPGLATKSTTQQDYDGNGNLRFLRQGIESTPHVTESRYDGHDRLQDRIDAMGNLLTYRYDADSNVTQESVLGQLVDDVNPGPRVLLHEQLRTYDATDRLAVESNRHFNPITGASIGDGASTKTHVYDGLQLVRVVDDRGNATNTTYDTAHRRQVVTDAKSNSSTFAYDANSNVVSLREDDRSDISSPVQVFTTTFVYDGLNRQTRSTDNRGNAITTGYDSRSNPVRTLDANGNEVRDEFDGLSRHLRTMRDMNGNGASATDPADIVTHEAFDDSDRRSSRTDDNGNTTVYVYDALDRMIEERFADGTSKVMTYDVHDNLVTTRDGNANLVTETHDLLDRLSRRDIVPGPGVSTATTFEDFQYDGYSRLIRARDNDSTVARKYDSLDNVIEEDLNGRITTSVFDGMSNKTACVYPSNLRIDMTYDALNRLRTVRNPTTTLASYDYVGPERVERRSHGNGTQARFQYDGYTGAPVNPGDFGVKRTVGTLHERIVGGVVLDDRTNTWDRMGNKKSRSDVRVGGPLIDQQFTYDRAYRMTRSTRTGSAPVDYTLDGVHNRLDPGYVMLAATPEPADFQMNQYSKTASLLPYDKDSDLVKRGRNRPVKSEARSYDGNGNLTVIASHATATRMVYDYRNQMVEHDALGKRSTYQYDAFGRRWQRTVGSVGTAYVHDGWRVIEEYTSGFGALTATYAYGSGIDEPITMQRAGQLYYFHADDQGNVGAVTDTAGNVVERYDYSDFGGTHFRSANGSPRAESAIGNVVLYNGRWLDAETGFYYFRTRYLEPAMGRFTARDTIGIWGDAANVGNGLTCVGDSPWSFADVFGTSRKWNGLADLLKATKSKKVWERNTTGTNGSNNRRIKLQLWLQRTYWKDWTCTEFFIRIWGAQKKGWTGIWYAHDPSSVTLSGSFGGPRSPLNQWGGTGYIINNPFSINVSYNPPGALRQFMDCSSPSMPHYEMSSGVYSVLATIDNKGVTATIGW